MVSFVNMEITLFTYVNLTGRSKALGIWFLKVKFMPYV